MTPTALWVVFFAMAAATFALRASFLLLQERLRLPGAVARALRYVPAAVLAAISVPALVAAQGAPLPGPAWLDTSLVAGVIAALVAWRTKNILATIGVGMACLWLFGWLAG